MSDETDDEPTLTSIVAKLDQLKERLHRIESIATREQNTPNIEVDLSDMNSSSSPDLMRLSEEIEHLRQSLSDGQKIERGQMLRTIILRSVVGGILIAAGALIVYPPIKDVVVAKGDRAQIIADIAKFDADLQKRKNDERERELRIENERIREDLNDLLVKETDLKQVLETRSKEYRRLSEQYGTVAAKFDSLAEK